MSLSKNHHLPRYFSLLFLAGFLAGCATNSARPGAVCGHCDYRFSRLTPNPCDGCIPEVILPGYGHTLTSWQVWPEGIDHSHIVPAPLSRPPEEVSSPGAKSAEPTLETLPPTWSLLQPNQVLADALPAPVYRRPRR